ncbi:MAG: TetR/AcrR family transcriptional regulator [Clostridia bacterium]
MTSYSNMPSKERIMDAAIELFSEKGFFETSVRELAERSNLKVSSLYSHYSSKDEILKAVLDYYQNEMSRASIPDEKLDEIISQYSLVDILLKGFDMILDTTSSPRINKIIKILVMEMYRNEAVREFYQQWYLDENMSTMTKIFTILKEQGKISNVDTELLASMYNALINLYYHEYFILKLNNEDTYLLVEKIKNHILLFVNLIKER